MDRQAHQFMSFVESCFFYGSTVFSQWLSYVEETRNGDSHALHLRMTKFLPIWESCRRILSWTWLDGVSERSLFTIHFWTKQEVLILLVHQKMCWILTWISEPQRWKGNFECTSVALNTGLLRKTRFLVQGDLLSANFYLLPFEICVQMKMVEVEVLWKFWHVSELHDQLVARIVTWLGSLG